MRKLKEVLRLHSLGLKQQQIARSCVIAQSTVDRYLKEAAAASVSWPLPPDWDERRLEEVVSGAPRPTVAWHKAGMPDFDAIRRQLQTHRNLTLQLAWEEYREDHHDGYSYSRYVAAVFMLRDHLKAMTVPGIGNVPQHKIHLDLADGMPQ